MHLKRFNEALSKYYKEEMSIPQDNSIKSKIRHSLEDVANEFKYSDKSSVDYSDAFVEVLNKYFPDDEWYNVTECSIYTEMFNKQEPFQVIDCIINGLKVNNTDNVNECITEDIDTISDQQVETELKDLTNIYGTAQAKVLDELSYLTSTEYEAVTWYDEAIPKIQSSGLPQDIIISTIEGIEAIRKDEDDHIAHLERLIKQIKELKLIDGTN